MGMVLPISRRLNEIAPVRGGLGLRGGRKPWLPNAHLALAFDDGKYRNGDDYTTDITALSGYSYTRSGAKSELNSSGSLQAFPANVPGITDEGYWSRQAFTNLALHSADLTQPAWVKTNVTATAGSLLETATTAEHFSEQVISATGDTTLSVEVQALGRDVVRFALGTSSGIYGLTYTFSTNTFSFLGTAITSATAQNVADGYKRIVIKSNNGANRFRLQPTEGGSTTYTGDPAKGLRARRMQIVQASVPGPYIATTSSTATAGEDNLQVTLPSALADQDMLIWATGKPKELLVGPYFFRVGDGTSNNRFDVGLAGSSVGYAVVVGGSIIVNSGSASGLAVANETITVFFRRAAGAWRGGFIKAGALTWVTSAITGAFPAGASKFFVGGNGSSGGNLRGPISAARILPGTFSTDAEILAAIGAS